MVVSTADKRDGTSERRRQIVLIAAPREVIDTSVFPNQLGVFNQIRLAVLTSREVLQHRCLSNEIHHRKVNLC